jgi:hypothetical protein
LRCHYEKYLMRGKYKVYQRGLRRFHGCHTLYMSLITWSLARICAKLSDALIWSDIFTQVFSALQPHLGTLHA